MMDVTDRHFRWVLRQITRRTLIYTEMVTTGAILRGDAARHLDFDPIEHPVALQLGGDEPAALARCAKMAEERGYDEIGLNVGCPSARVASGSFGACLMKEPARVAEAVAAMRAAVSIPVTVKHRIGVDELDRYEDMERFVLRVAEAGCDRFVVHARKAWLKGLSPKENRTLPPLRWADVHRLKAAHPHLSIEINGGFGSLDGIESQLRHVDGVMVGRAAEERPFALLHEADVRFYGADGAPTDSPEQVAEAALGYVARQLARGERLPALLKPLQNVFAGRDGARAWRRALAQLQKARPADAGEALKGLHAALPGR
jgi:tRNA-dihydrouridine synthase A